VLTRVIVRVADAVIVDEVRVTALTLRAVSAVSSLCVQHSRPHSTLPPMPDDDDDTADDAGRYHTDFSVECTLGRVCTCVRIALDCVCVCTLNYSVAVHVCTLSHTYPMQGSTSTVQLCRNRVDGWLYAVKIKSGYVEVGVYVARVYCSTYIVVLVCPNHV
jgi:hypothetical protein